MQTGQILNTVPAGAIVTNSGLGPWYSLRRQPRKAFHVGVGDGRPQNLLRRRLLLRFPLHLLRGAAALRPDADRQVLEGPSEVLHRTGVLVLDRLGVASGVAGTARDPLRRILVLLGVQAAAGGRGGRRVGAGGAAVGVLGKGELVATFPRQFSADGAEELDASHLPRRRRRVRRDAAVFRRW